MAELRPYQMELLQRVLHALETDDRKRVMLQLPTGGGKTVIAGELLAHLLGERRRAVWLTHRRGLVEQTCEMLNRDGVRAITDPGWKKGDEAQARRGATVILMAQTTGNHAKQGKIWGGYDANDLMVIDEAHHVPADSYVRAMEQWPGWVMGMTATPWRLSEKEGFDHLFNQLVCGPQIKELQSMGALCRTRVLVPSAEQRIVGGPLGQDGDYTEAGIVSTNESRPRRVMTAEAVKIWQEYAADRQTIAYAVTIKHANNLLTAFQRAGIRAKVIHTDTNLAQRDAAIDGFKRGAVKVLINVLVATEGFDLPDASCVMMARPTKSLALYLQMVGRGLRPKPDGGDCLILDLAGNTLEHGLPEAHRSWSLAPRGKQPDGEPAVDDDTVRELGGKSCGRCGRLRGWKSWEYEHHCGDAHDLVCDLCHIDAHIAARLPVNPLLDTLVDPVRHSDGLARLAEYAALVALYDATDGQNWIRKDNWLTDAPLEEWYGVSVGDNGRVNGLKLSLNRLRGEPTKELGRLTNLRVLDLSGNQLIGEVPRWLGDLTNLTILRLGGGWHRDFGLGGGLPAELVNLTNLRELHLPSSQLTGEIPRWLGNLTNLNWLNFRGNRLSGEIPRELERLTNLRTLNLGSNQLTGEVPRWLGNLTDLDTLFLNYNRLSGEIPWELSNLTSLRALSLGGNQLTGEIPHWLGNFVNLTDLSLYDNRLSGEIPCALERLTNLTGLRLDGNQLTGDIPGWLGNFADLMDLSLHSNGLSGGIPWELGHLTNLSLLHLDGNQLSGEIPWALGRLNKLIELRLNDNQLAGDIPWELGRLANLGYLDLRHNRLAGEIPIELCRLDNLETIYLSGNGQLTGCIPEGLRNVEVNDLDELGLPFC